MFKDEARRIAGGLSVIRGHSQKFGAFDGNRPLQCVALHPEFLSSMGQPHFVFVHGAWQGGWCFGLLRLELSRRAVRTTAIDLPAMGDDETPAAAATFEDGVQRIVDVVAEHRKVVLVGHSLGGIYVTEAALRLPEPPKRIVYIAAYVPVPGDSFESLSEMAPLHPDLQAGGGQSPIIPRKQGPSPTY